MKLWKTAASLGMVAILLTACDDPDDVLSPPAGPSPDPDPDPVPVATTLTIVSGDGQTGVVDQSASSPLVVEVRDDSNALMAGVDITWTASPGSSFIDTDDQTGVDGRASATWRMGTTAGDYSAQAAAAPGSVMFSATAGPGTPDRMEMVGGDGQTATSGSEAPDPLVVRIFDEFDNVIPGAMVSWSASHSGAADPASVPTATNGQASTVWTLGCPAANQTATASLGALSADFGATAEVGLPNVVLKITGDNQVGLIGLVLAEDVVVRVEDACGNPIAGVTVDFAITSLLGGSVNPLSAVTNASGEVTATWTLGLLGGHALEVAVDVGGSLLTTLFNATAIL